MCMCICSSLLLHKIKNWHDHPIWENTEDRMVQPSDYLILILILWWICPVSLFVLWVAIHIWIGFIDKLFWKMFPANPIFIATDACWIQFSTRTMQHVFHHFLIKLGQSWCNSALINISNSYTCTLCLGKFIQFGVKAILVLSASSCSTWSKYCVHCKYLNLSRFFNPDRYIDQILLV